MRYFHLNTVTYGTACAPYLVTKCLQHLTQRAPTIQQLGADAIQQNFYVDDCLSGADTLEEVIRQRDQIGSAKLRLRKWCASHPDLLNDIPRGDQALDLDFSQFSDATIKTLGKVWNPKEDKGRATPYEQGRVTKRDVRSELSKIFDPLGLLYPITTEAKIFMQQLWQKSLGWDIGQGRYNPLAGVSTR